MNRKIDFKAWDSKYNVMIKGFAIYANGDHLGMSIHDSGEFYEENDLESDSKHFSEGDDWIFIMDDFTLLQFTGLTDKLHYDIYEGDLLKSGQGNLFKVLWHEAEAQWAVDCLTGDDIGLCELKKYMEENLEVIGNIYENPDLLK
jgi:hypothetical protein